jgi:hypothetical protein
VNENGEVVGIAHDSSWYFLPFIYDETNGMQELTRDSNYLNGEWYAVVINDFGLIGGHVIDATNQSLPFYWENKSALPTQVSMPAAFPYGEIYGLNSSGEMVGIMWDTDQADAIEHAFIFDGQNGVMDLNDLINPGSGWILEFARDINDAGQIVGTGDLMSRHQKPSTRMLKTVLPIDGLSTIMIPQEQPSPMSSMLIAAARSSSFQALALQTVTS